MVVAIPLATQTQYSELKYALRSIEKNLPEMEVVIIGAHIPDWLHNITQIIIPDIPGRKQLTIRRKIFAALTYSDRILFSNDDIYFLKPVNPETLPYYTKTITLTKETEGGVRPLRKTLEAMGKPINHYDCHYPIVYERTKFCELEMFPADCIIKSMYGNYHELPPEPIQDCKIDRKATPEMIRSMVKYFPCLSTGPIGLPSVLKVLEEIFPNKSKYEL